MLRDLSEDDIKSLINSDTMPIKEIQKFSCHTQAVERYPASEETSSQPVAPLHCFGSDVPIVLTSMQEKGESLMGKNGAGGRVIQFPPSQATNVFFFSPLLCGSLHYRPRAKPLNSRALVEPYSPIRLLPFSCTELSTTGTSLLKQ
ncbi:hypothetical protein AVEN_369-1 [Araneus ventricosus]|uniref:Uncharacterized protein n=1 Tax=Araneus ventricosus TaxID=182803 RepID=A0A4Y2DUS0_ARAVE|nr:hypothetical protein AVEN_369-1 [Araneus ventricosus]